MNDVVFVHPKHKYDSYTDFRRLVELSGFETCDEDQINSNRNCTYVVSPMNGDVRNALAARPKPRTCKVVYWFLERPAPHGGPNFCNMIIDALSTLVDQFWVSDKSMFLPIQHISGTKFVVVGSDEGLGSKISSNKNYDVTHMSYVYGRRDNIIHSLKCRIGPNCWGIDRHNVLLQSRMMINTHQDNDGYYEPLRFALCAAYALPMISESCLDTHPYENGVDFISAPYGTLNSLINQAVASQIPNLQSYGERMWQKATKQFRFVDNVKKAITGG